MNLLLQRIRKFWMATGDRPTVVHHGKKLLLRPEKTAWKHQPSRKRSQGVPPERRKRRMYKRKKKRKKESATVVSPEIKILPDDWTCHSINEMSHYSFVFTHKIGEIAWNAWHLTLICLKNIAIYIFSHLQSFAPVSLSTKGFLQHLL